VVLGAADTIGDEFINGPWGGFYTVRMGCERTVYAQDRHVRIFAKKLLTGGRDAQVTGALGAMITVTGARYVELRLVRADSDEDAVIGFFGHLKGGPLHSE
jgi:hypothetical protein